MHTKNYKFKIFDLRLSDPIHLAFDGNIFISQELDQD